MPSCITTRTTTGSQLLRVSPLNGLHRAAPSMPRLALTSRDQKRWQRRTNLRTERMTVDICETSEKRHRRLVSERPFDPERVHRAPRRGGQADGAALPLATCETGIATRNPLEACIRRRADTHGGSDERLCRNVYALAARDVRNIADLPTTSPEARSLMVSITRPLDLLTVVAKNGLWPRQELNVFTSGPWPSFETTMTIATAATSERSRRHLGQRVA